MVKNKDKEMNRLDKITKLELMIEEYGFVECLGMLHKANNNIIINRFCDKLKLNPDETRKIKEDLNQ